MAVPFGFTVPETVAVVGAIALTGPVDADGAVAAAAVPAPTRVPSVSMRTARAVSCVRIVGNFYPLNVREHRGGMSGGRKTPPQALDTAERELAIRDEPGDADADETQRAGPVAQTPVEQAARQVADLRCVVDPDVE